MIENILLEEDQHAPVRCAHPSQQKFCQPFLRFGVCPSGDECVQRHHTYERNVTIVLPNFFRHPALISEDREVVESYTVEDLEEEYGKFYCDIIWRFRTVAPVVMFKCVRNTAKHLCGNVYVQYAHPEQASTAMVTFNSALSEQYSVEAALCHVTDWRAAICGIESCPTGLGSSCEYLHVFTNPGNEYSGRPDRLNNGPRISDKNHKRTHTRQRSRSPLGRYRGSNTVSTIRSHRRKDKPKQPCIYYNKTGACIFGDACHLTHRSTADATTILVQNMYQYVFTNPDENDKVQFEQFYYNSLAWFGCIGTVKMFKCSRNLLPHLKGNVYIQYESQEQAVQAVNEYSGTEFDGRVIQVQLCPITNWKGAICRSSPCMLGVAQCTDLHVYRNPGNAFAVSRWD